MFFAAQHPSGTSPFIHYSSPRLRKDAKEDTQRLVNDFGIMVKGLLHARRKDALELGKTLAKANDTVERAKAEAKEMREAMQNQQTELAKMNTRQGLGFSLDMYMPLFSLSWHRYPTD
jgi:hypothetical protein